MLDSAEHHHRALQLANRYLAHGGYGIWQSPCSNVANRAGIITLNG
jgi:hypothetical protein